MDDFVYQGTELDLFAEAVNWKAYWSSVIRPYVGPDVLDVGAGAGATARLLCGPNQKRWVALEPDAELARRMRRDQDEGRLNPLLDVRAAALSDLKTEVSFDTVLYIDVLEHIEDHEAELRRANGWLRPNGFLIVLSPAHQFLFSPFDRAIGHFRRYSRATIEAVTPPGASVVRIDYLDCIGLAASFGNRFFLRSSMPTRGQIALWDKTMVPISRFLDGLAGYSLGKSVLAVWQKAA